jgi:Secretion system C-terminal sorting domain/Calx-beta domain
MKNFTKICILLLGFVFSGNTLLAQKIAVVGIDHSSPAANGGDYDGISFVATENLIAGTVFYFTNGLYDSPNTRFRSLNAADDGIKFIIKYTVPVGGIAKGVVVYIQETNQTSNTLATTCSSGSCGSATFLVYNGAASNFSIGSIVMGIWAYSDTDDNPLNGITTVHSVLFEGWYDSGTGVQTVGNLPANMNPIGSFPNAIITDGIFSSLPAGTVIFNIVEFKPSLRSGAVSKLNLEDPSNYDKFIPGSTSLSTTAFANLNLVATNPTVGVTVSPSSVTENGATNLTYTFTLSANAASNITVNYTATGTATNGTDYGSITGTAVILSGTNSITVIVNPSGDATLEPDETVTLTVASGTGYDIGSPSSATGTIKNDDTGTSLPKVALVGISHADFSTNPTHVDGFSFVALEDITPGTVIHFTRRIYDKTTLVFNNFYTGTVKWTAGTGVNRGDVYTVMETAADVFTVTCSDGSNCGTIANIDASFTIPTTGITMFAYADNNDNPTDGVTEIYSALHTGDLVAFTNGGAIPTNSNPASVYPNAVVIDNFPNANPARTEYKFPTERQVTVNRTLLVNTANWLHAQTTATALSTVRFTNIIVTSGTANPLVTVSASPASVLENNGTGMVYTFTLSQNATSNLTINFSVSGTATFATDYTQTGASTFTASTGSVTIAIGSNTASVTITPTADAVLEPNETVILTINTGTGYDAGSPNVATGIITNDDIKNVNNLVVIIGMNHGGNATEPDGFSFAANQNIAAGTDIYFVDGLFNNTSLSFGTLEAVVKYTVPTGGLAKGQVVYVVETGQTTNTFSVSCSAGSNCGTATYITQANPTDFSCAISGDNLYAYTDTDGDPTNGITDVHALFYAINNAIPSLENPTTVFPNAVVVSGFGSSSPNRTEYKFAASERSAPINLANIQNIANYLIAQTTQNLSVIPFTGLSLCPATITGQPALANICAGANSSFTVTATGTNLTYQWQVNTGSGFTNITNTGIYTGATVATLTLTAVPLANNGFTYRCVVNDCATSNAVALTVNVLPTITLGTVPSICAGATSFTIPYTATTNTPTTYSLSGTGFTTLTDAVLPITPILVNLTSAAVFGTNPTYNLTVKNANGCVSTMASGSITVNASSLPANAQVATQNVNNNSVSATGCALIANILPNGVAPVNGNVTAKVWIETTQPVQFVKRHYEINPATNAANATAKVTLYFTDAEFNAFNTQTTPPSLLLPISTDLPATITARKANLRVEKRAGTGDVNGTLNSYTGAISTIDPVDADIIWNATASRWEVSFDVIGFSGFWAKTQTTVLPLNLLAFTGTKTSNGNLLEWKTSSEVNTKSFDVEKQLSVSVVGGQWSLVNTQLAVGNGANTYSYLDADKMSGTVLYRLKMIDLDGRFTYSNIIKLSSNPLSGGRGALYPNPITTTATLEIGDRKLLNTQANIIDANGRTIKTFTIKNNFEIVDMCGLPSGLYILKMSNGETQKIIKQ